MNRRDRTDDDGPGSRPLGSTVVSRSGSPRNTPGGESNRAQSELVGTVLVLGLSLLVVGATLAVGAAVLTDRQADADIRSAETSMTSFASKAALVSAGTTDARAVSLPGNDGGSTMVDPDQGRLVIELQYDLNETDTETLVNRSLGGVTYQRGDTRVAYEGGGVWRSDGPHARMVSPPPVHYRGTTFTMPVPIVEGGTAAGGNAIVTRGGPVERIYPNPAVDNRTNPLSAATVHVTVESDYYEAWGQFFETRTGGTVTYAHDENRVTLRLATEDPDRRLADAVAGTSTGPFEIRGAGGSSFTDSYNSSIGPYDPDNPGSDGRVVTAGDLDLGGGATVYGDATAGGSVDIGGASAVYGNVSYGNSYNVQGNPNVTGWVAQNASVATAAPIDTYVNGHIGDIAEDNQNDNTTAINGTTLTNDAENGDTITLSAGSYYLSDLNLGNRTLRLDVSEGDVRLALASDLVVQDGTIEVVGDGGRVRTFVSGDVTVNGGEVTVTNDTSPRMWVYGTRDAAIRVSNGGTYVGVLYAPAGSSGTGTVDVRSDGAVYGAVVGGQTTLQAGGSIHFDTALRGMDPVFDEDVPRVTYLHVTGNPIVVER